MDEPRNVRTRALLLASFYAASRVAVHGAMVLTEASAAGMMLHMHRDCGDAIRACAAMPSEDDFWSRVARAIAQVAIDEDVEDRPLRAVGGG